MNEHFDAVAWMRQKRAAIDKQDERLTWEEKSRKTTELLRGDPLWERLKARVAQPPTLAPRRTAQGSRRPRQTGASNDK